MMKNAILIIGLTIFLLVPANASAQNLRQENASDSIAKLANKKSMELAQNLGLTTKQTLLVEDKLTEFMIYRMEIDEAKLTPEKRSDRLKALDNAKFSEMREILTRRQYKAYLKMK